MTRVVNTGPLIFLGKLDRLELLTLGAARVVVPEGVISEVAARKDEAFARIEKALDAWLERQSVRIPQDIQFLPDLGRGEAEVLLLARELGTTDVVLDDLDARRYARRLGLRPIGTVGLLLVGKQRGLVPSVADEMDRLARFGFRISLELLRHALEAAGESPAIERPE